MPQIGEIKKSREIGYNDSHKHIWQACSVCGKCRWVYLLKNNKPVSTRCLSCALNSDEVRTKISATNKQRIRLRGARTGKYAPYWKGGQVQCICLECSKVFFCFPSRIKDGGGKFCCHSCRSIYCHKQGAYDKTPNKPEQVLISLFAQNGLPFKYTGAGEVWFGNRNPDFINTNGAKQVIEFMGEYWHPLFDGAGRVEHYKEYGYTCLVIWEDEMKDTKKILARIKKFTKTH